jgi:hypothetical protein
MPPTRIDPVYRPHGDGGRFLLFDSELDVKTRDGTWSAAPVQIELELFPTSRLRARVFGPAAVSAFFDDTDEVELQASDDTDLAPPSAPATTRAERESHHEFRISRLRLGALPAADHLLIHISGALDVHAERQELSDGSHQPQLQFALPGWDLFLVPGEPTLECRDFAAVIRATPTSAISARDVDRLHRWLFILLSFVANREVGIGPVCGLDKNGAIVWAQWDAPRVKPGKPGVKWCPPLLTTSALPELAAGLAAVADDPDLEVIVDRAIGYALAANGEEVIEVRIPIVCSGLELLAWAILQREDWLVDPSVRRRMKTAAVVRLLLKWAGIPTSVPGSLPILGARLGATGKADWEGPEILFELRNAMVHPPKRLDNIQWPEGEELVDAWLLGTWCLELALLRVLGYEGEYWSRIRLNRPAGDLEPVPWVSDE